LQFTVWAASCLDVAQRRRADLVAILRSGQPFGVMSRSVAEQIYSPFTVWAASWLDVAQRRRADLVAIYGVGGLLAWCSTAWKGPRELPESFQRASREPQRARETPGEPPESTREPHRAPDNPQKASESFREPQRAPESPREPLESFRELQRIFRESPESTREAQRVPESRLMSRDVEDQILSLFTARAAI
jgi:hypothetical protein